ncbi:MAG: RNA methyltransferase [Bacillota bacterium]|nr:RNA methyltransferase [Bacillota bacterium]
MRKSRVFVGLLHYPMSNKRKDTITTSITNLDLHDIARATRSYDVEGFYVVHPSATQQTLIKDILSYWQEGYGGTYNPDRKEAFSRLKLVSDLEDAIHNIEQETGQKVITVATDAAINDNTLRYRDLKRKIFDEEQVYLILFGTGWGMTQALLDRCDYILEPIEGSSDYNHLSVRSAVSIIIDRLLGEFWFQS